MELIIKETKTGTKIKETKTGTKCDREESRPQEPQFKIKNGTLVRCELNGYTTITIPADVKTIGKECFADTDVQEVTLPEGIESIESKAFVNCFKLKKINFSEGLEFVKDRAFMNCISLAKVALPETLTELGDYAFYNAGIKQLTLPDPKNVLSAGINVFGAIKIKNISIPKDFRLSKAMFATCQQLCSVNFEARWVNIPERCFYHCTNLTKVDISKALFIKDAAFLECHRLSVSVIPAHTYVSACAFMKTGVEDVTIEDISKIEKRAFFNCKSLEKLTINISDGLAAAGSSVPEELAAYCTRLQTVVFTGDVNSLSDIKAAAFMSTVMLTEISLPDSVQTIEQYAFCNSGIEVIHLPENLKQIGTGAFASSDIKRIIIPDKVTSLGNGIFNSCHELTDITLPESVTEIPGQTFINCYKLKAVNAPSITVVGSSAFCNCKMLKTFDFSQVKEFGDASFAGTGICEAVLSSKLSKLQPSVFCNCKDLQAVDMSACNKVKTIPTRYFEGCNKLTDVKLPPNVHKFSDDCFESVKFDRLVIKAGTRIDFHAFGEAVINELEFIDDADSQTKTIVDAFAFARAKIGRLVIPDYMYNRFEKAISKMQ